MQSPTASPRDALTTDQVVGLIQGAPGITVGCGAELLGLDLTVQGDISADLAGGTVERHAYNTLHGAASLQISRDLDWGAAIVRPYMTISDGTVVARFNLGAYFTSTPTRPFGQSPPTYTVACYDILQILDDRVGDAYSIDAGIDYLVAVEGILVALGVTEYLIDQQAAGTLLPTPRSWVLDNTTTWLTIVNDLLASIGYAGIWSDWDGRLRVVPYQAPSDRGSEWVYSDDPAIAIHGPDGTVEHDFYNAPNRWVLYRGNNVDSTPPVEGDGIYTVVNQSTGDTSVDARGGRIVSRVESLDVADHPSLVRAAQSLIDADMQIGTKITTPSSPNPLHWHFDRVTVNDAGIGPVADVLSTDWTLPLDGGNMTHIWSLI